MKCPLCDGSGQVPDGSITLGDRVRALRGENLQKATADILGISRAQLANIEGGRGNPSFEVLLAMARHWKVTTDYLLGHETPEEAQ